MNGFATTRSVIYDPRHTCLTRWAKTMDPFTPMKLAGHADLNTTMPYVRLNDDDVRAAMEGVNVAKGGHKIGHSNENGHADSIQKGPYRTDSKIDIWSWRRGLNPRPSDYKSDALPAELRQRRKTHGSKCAEPRPV